ncbi:zinc finger-like domain-containing protein [Aeromonas salmonicida]|nr:zinc finger-like domain-containing protein [Aeromonas salmonicida]ELY2000721.1 zinc finger-like domain-containing protein [Aeromonas salmonicida]MCR4453811.1 hypothetical protein [Aeromonas salmonicida]
MKRYDLELTATGPVMEERKEGAFVPFSEVEQLQAKIFELQEKFHRTGVAIERAISTGSVLADHPLKSRLELLANHHEREMELAAQLSDATRQCGVMAGLLREANDSVYFHLESPDSRLSGEEAGKLIALTESIADALAGKLPVPADQHPDDAAVDRFVVAMKAKLAAAREKGRGGWDDPNACSVEYLADLLVDHVAKGNAGTFEDVANFAMMLHQRGADPAVLALAATLTTCTRCEGHGMIGGITGQTPESMDFWEAGCPDCDGRGKLKLSARTITEGQEFELTTVIQAIASGFSDDPAHDAAALLKRITGEVPWTGDSFQLPPRQGGEPCATEPRSSSPA